MVAKNLFLREARKLTGGIQMTTTATYGTLSASQHSTQLRKAVIASTIGTAIEWYDFFLYGTAAGLIFGKLFFPNSDPLTATLAAFGTYFIGFVGRPIGAAIFGHYGDRTIVRNKSDYLLTGLVFDDAGHRMVPTHATKAGVRYRYYVSTPFLHGEAKTASAGSVSRIPAADIEDIVVKF